MEEVESWIGTGSRNKERFFRDPDGPADLPNTAGVSVGGMFMFNVGLSAPHAITMRSKPSSPSLQKFLALAEAADRSSIGAALDAATAAYSKIADAFDEEQADDEEGEEDGGDDDMMDRLNAEARERDLAERNAAKAEIDAQFQKIREQFDIDGMNKATVERILTDYSKVHGHDHFGWRASPQGRDLTKWSVELYNFEKELKKDMEKVKARSGRDTIDMEMTFPKNYPFQPPFIRVLRPRFMPRTGRVTIGGSICTQLLTDEGWKPVYDIEAIIETIRQQITDEESGAKIDHNNTNDFTLAEAKDAFDRVAAYHKANGWN